MTAAQMMILIKGEKRYAANESVGCSHIQNAEKHLRAQCRQRRPSDTQSRDPENVQDNIHHRRSKHKTKIGCLMGKCHQQRAIMTTHDQDRKCSVEQAQ